MDRARHFVRFAEPPHERVAPPNVGETARLGVRDERRRDVSRSDGVDPDAAGRPFGRKRLRQMGYSGLGSVVVGLALRALAHGRVRGRSRDNRPVADSRGVSAQRGLIALA
jgi:hypothetical protein